jgi:hypothetical protein
MNKLCDIFVVTLVPVVRQVEDLKQLLTVTSWQPKELKKPVTFLNVGQIVLVVLQKWHASEHAHRTPDKGEVHQVRVTESGSG